MLELGVKILAAYLVGSLMGALLIGRIRGGVDIRGLGSGNAGGTNALRTQGRAFALGVVAIDVGKGLVAVAIAFAPLPPVDPAMPRELVLYGCAFAGVVGHVWPVWHDFRGGKGAATALGVTAVLAPAIVLPLLIVWTAIIVLTGYVGLATVMTVLSAPLLVALGYPVPDFHFLWFALALAVLITWTHRGNLQRLRAGTEVRTQRLMLRRRSGATTTDQQ